MKPKAERLIDQLLDLAAQEREILVAGELERLAALEPVKTGLLERLRSVYQDADPAALDRLRRRTVENQRLYQSALSGIMQVRDRIAALLKSGSAEFQTYEPDGVRKVLSRSDPRLEHKA